MWFGSPSPVAFANVDLVRPIRRASSFIMRAKAASLPAMPSPTHIDASLPDCTAMPWISSLTVTLVLTGTIIADVPDGAPPLRQALTLIVNSSVVLMRPDLMARKSTASVISLLMLAGGAS